MEESNQTAVNYLISELIEHLQGKTVLSDVRIHSIIESALAIEKEQLIDARLGAPNSRSLNTDEHAEDWYREKFKTEDDKYLTPTQQVVRAAMREASKDVRPPKCVRDGLVKPKNIIEKNDMSPKFFLKWSYGEIRHPQDSMTEYTWQTGIQMTMTGPKLMFDENTTLAQWRESEIKKWEELVAIFKQEKKIKALDFVINPTEEKVKEIEDNENFIRWI